jgi:hypothetical protein
MKLTNASLNLASITADSYSLTLDSRPIIAATDTVKLSVNAICGNYSLDFNQVPQLQGKAILLKDNYLSKVVMIIAGFSYPFTIHLSDSATYGDNRFQLIIVNQSQVPVSLVYFDATKKDATTNLITWATAYERQSDYFELQRSFNGFDYDLVAILKAKGNSLDLNEYKYDDEPLLMNENMPIYYRLKMVDLDGTFTYADAVILKPSKNNPSSDGLFSISPNPATDHILLKCNANEQQTIVMMQIADLQGRILEQYEGYKERINVSLIKTGIYHLVILKQNGLKETLRFIKN